MNHFQKKGASSKKVLLKKADFHAHTYYSDGFFSPEEVVLAAIKKHIRFLAITDHNQIAGAFSAQKFAFDHKLNITLIIGEEISTKEGEIIGLFLSEKIPKSLSAEITCRLIKGQGGLVMIPHPFRKFIGKGLSYSQIMNLRGKGLVDLLEINNFWDYPGLVPKRKKLFGCPRKLPWLSNSDSHSISTLGTLYNLTTAVSLQDLKKSLLKGEITYPPDKIHKYTRLLFLGEELIRKTLRYFLGKRRIVTTGVSRQEK